MKWIPAMIAVAGAAVLSTETVASRGSAPSPEELAQDSLRAERMERDLERAAPWKEALVRAFMAEPDTALREEAVRLVFLTTYKHRLPGADTSGADTSGADSSGTAATSRDSTRLRKDAQTFHRAWARLKSVSTKAGIPPLAVAEAVYRFTNSDWAPANGARGPGLDRVASAKDYRAWVDALVPVGRKALEAGLDPAVIWGRQAASYTVREPKDLKTAPLQPPQPRF
jgi:hypothetical protein